MPGVQVFTYLNVGKETTRGTPVAPTRQLYMDGTGVLDVDPALSFHESENAGVRTRIRRATQQSEDVRLKAKTSGDGGVSFDDLVVPFSQLKGGVTGTGAGADKSWVFTPAMTGNNNPEAYSIDVGDDTQNFRIQYGMIERFKLSAALGGLTQLETDWFGQRAIKTAKASPAINSAPKIVGELWTAKFAATMAGLTGASVQTNLLVGWDLEIVTGLVWRHYMDGNLYGAQHAETDIAGTLNLKVESTAFAVSEFYDKALSQTLDFVRLKATGPTLGASNYSAQLDLPVLWDIPKVISEEDDGVNLYAIPARMAYDGTAASSIQPTIVNSLAALP